MKKWIVRAGIAGNPKTPKKILAKLAEDENIRVRDAARERLEGLLRH